MPNDASRRLSLRLTEMKLPRNKYFASSHLGDSLQDHVEIEAFSVSHPETGRGLELYLKEQALQDERLGVMRTYLVRFKRTGELVGYYSLKTGLVSINEERSSQAVSFDTLPGVELANFAVNNAFLQKHNAKGLGNLLFTKLIVPFIKEHAKTLGIYMIYLFALPYTKLIQTYERYGFKRLTPKDEGMLHQRLKPAYDKACIFMYQPLSEM